MVVQQPLFRIRALACSVERRDHTILPRLVAPLLMRSPKRVLAHSRAGVEPGRVSHEAREEPCHE
jgi:hypothetical protein